MDAQKNLIEMQLRTIRLLYNNCICHTDLTDREGEEVKEIIKKSMEFLKATKEN